jgi:hypothetical protein
MSRMPEGLPDREPTRRDLAAIEAEWPLIEAGLTALDAEIRRLLCADVADELDVRRVRRARRRVLRAPAASVARGSWGGEAA